MSTPAELVAAMLALVAGVAETAADPSDRVRLLMALAEAPMPAGGNAALAAVGRRAALSALARAATACQPRSYDEAESLRTDVCELLATEEIVAADAGEDAVATALRAVRGAVDRDLRRRGANLSPLRPVEVKALMPSLVLAQRLYGDAGREPEITRMAGDPPNPIFMPERFTALAR
ncbi:hypothetical protein EAH89_17290 [Roseomonas nepalensis]|uniref:Uncharacterized protein n=1 Tax=Muricoccus nepalensis TaxID=1854500 RepID=A0A502FVI4_9PROT|nr:hypothetical protein [Roseomonas nepalensis]TPG53272.1 hypothetical protein EAH89_17290 [Roseomonas nepalensis]